jgi:YegS/Rv2252/BmrU family lipid kinase
LFIINPVAGKKPDINRLQSEITNLMSENEQNWEIYITKAPLDACDKVRNEAAISLDRLRVYACGGDGTLNEVVNGAVGFSHVSVTHYPTGTGNDFLRTFGPDDFKLFQSLRLLVNGQPLPLDLIECNGRYSINICSVGIDARIGADVHKFSKLPLVSGMGGYILSLISNLFKGINRKLKLNYGDREYSGCYALICACNGRYYGGGFNPVPEAIPDDGIIDFLIVKNVAWYNFLKLVGNYAKGKYKQLTNNITYYGGPEMIIESDKPLKINIDGEIDITNNLYFKKASAGISFIFPQNSAFFNSRTK